MLIKHYAPRPPLSIELWRGQVLESQHRVHAVVVNERGEVIHSWGDPALVTTARSSLKPFQLWSNLKLGAFAGLELSKAEVALMCASHNGEEMHTELCARLLARLGLDETALECGAHLPYDKEAAHQLIREGKLPTAIHNNCSGKHCGMLGAQLATQDPQSYLEVDHPVQAALFASLKSLLMIERELKWGVDGCSLPTPALKIVELAQLFSILAAARRPQAKMSDEHLDLIYTSMVERPEHVAGTGRFDTALMRAAGGSILSKVGGEAVRGLAIRHGTQRFGIAFKVEDGSMRALHPACLHVLLTLGYLAEEQMSEELRGFARGSEQSWAGRPATHIEVNDGDQ